MNRYKMHQEAYTKCIPDTEGLKELDPIDAYSAGVAVGLAAYEEVLIEELLKQHEKFHSTV